MDNALDPEFFTVYDAIKDEDFHKKLICNELELPCIVEIGTMHFTITHEIAIGVKHGVLLQMAYNSEKYQPV